MTTKKELDEKLEIARVAAHASELAAHNIKRYLEIHAETAAFVKPVNRVMKIADELTEDMERLISDSAELAAKSLRKFTGKE
ncbi:hypothetical protein AB7M22_002495 [Pseudomonas sp. ADAK2 TE3594]